MTAVPAEGPIDEATWARLRAEARQAYPSGGVSPDGVLLGYQKRLLETVSSSSVTVCEKSRRIGATWGVGALAVLTSGVSKASGGMDTLYIGYNLDMAREFVDVCAMWARAFGTIASQVREELFRDQDKDGGDRYIQAFRISFASGFEVVALASRPRSLRGRQGFVVIDEAAFHDDLEELLKAALALLIWGGKVLLISTHDGAENPFNGLCEDIRKGRKPYALVRITFDEALQDGLYQRICLVRGREWSPEGEAAWRSEIRAFYGDAAEEELDAVPRAGGGKYFPLHLVEARADPTIPVLRWTCRDDFVHLSETARAVEAAAWVREHVLVPLATLHPARRTALGGDFARSGDLTVFWPVQVGDRLVRRPPFVVELRNVPFDQQRQVLFAILDRLPRLGGVALDATGNGAYLAEVTAQRYGSRRVEQVKLTEQIYAEAFPRLKGAFEDGSHLVPADPAIVEDFRAVELMRGIPRVTDKRSAAKGEDKDKSGGRRHGDAAIAAMLAHRAAARDVADDTLDSLPAPDPAAAAGLGDFGGAMGLGRAGLAGFVDGRYQ
jgi:phage FluMu gp28-like protein